MTNDRLSILVTHVDGAAVLALQGEVDSFNANCLRQSVVAICELGVPVVLDMHLVTYMDSSGISALIAVSEAAHELRSSVHVTRASDQVRRVLSLTGLDNHFLAEP